MPDQNQSGSSPTSDKPDLRVPPPNLPIKENINSGFSANLPGSGSPVSVSQVKPASPPLQTNAPSPFRSGTPVPPPTVSQPSPSAGGQTRSPTTPLTAGPSAPPSTSPFSPRPTSPPPIHSPSGAINISRPPLGSASIPSNPNQTNPPSTFSQKPPAPTPQFVPKISESNSSTPGQPIKSTFRTMEEDLAALKKGQTPTSMPLQRPPQVTSPISPPIKPQTPPGQSPVTTPSQSPKISLPSDLQNLGKVSAPPSPPAPLTSRGSPQNLTSDQSDSNFDIPSSSRSRLSSTMIVIAVALVAIVGFSVWFFFFHKPSTQIGDLPSPTFTLTPTATPLPPLETVFSVNESVDTTLGTSFFSVFKNTANVTSLVAGEPALYKIINSATSQRYSLSDFTASTAVDFPTNLIASVDDPELYVSLIKKDDGSFGYGIIIRVTDPLEARNELTNFESLATVRLSNLFGIDAKKSASTLFLDNTYSDTQIRYRNFPDASMTIDYAIVGAPNGENYLVLSSSKQHMYSIIDKIKSIAPSL